MDVVELVLEDVEVDVDVDVLEVEVIEVEELLGSIVVVVVEDACLTQWYARNVPAGQKLCTGPDWQAYPGGQDPKPQLFDMAPQG